MANEKAQPTGMLAYIIAGREIRFKTVHAKCLFQYYCSNAGRDGTFFKSTLDIVADCHIAESTVRELNAGMKTKGLLSWVEGSNLTRKANMYTLHLDRMQQAALSGKASRESTKDKLRLQAAERSRRFRERHAAGRRDGEMSVTPESNARHAEK